MTPFTDDDLKRLKARNYYIPLSRNVSDLQVEELLVLIARLEAAERSLERNWKGHTTTCLEGKNLSGGSSVCICEMGDLYMAWLKSAGKDKAE